MTRRQSRRESTMADGGSGLSAHARRIFAETSRIPEGRVATYGQIAALAGIPRAPRLVGQALRKLPASSDVPWHRVINAKGMISPRGRPDLELLQRRLLEQEGVEFDDQARVSFAEVRWLPEEMLGER